MAGRNPWGSAPGPDGSNGSGNAPPTRPGIPGQVETGLDDKGSKPKNPWLPGGRSDGPQGERPRGSNVEELFRLRQTGRGSGGPGNPPRFPKAPGGKSWTPYVLAGIALLWLGLTSIHQINAKEQGIVTTFGKYERTLNPGLHLTLPWPVQNVQSTDVTSIRRDNIPEGTAEKLMLTGDQNLVDLSYLIRWNIKDLKLYTFQLAEPNETVLEVAEAAMRASIAEVKLDDALSGSGRAQVEQNVRIRMQELLDAYRAGVAVQGVEIKKADPPTRVIDAFKEVLAAQQDAQSDINRARAWAEQVTARAEGEAEAFDKVFQEYRLAPEVTRRRMYYETMERVLSQTDKTIVEADGVVPYLPLPEVNRTNRGSAPAATPAAPPATNATAREVRR
ncbi:protease modulator HflK [Croceicoccus sp. F390]|uniref:Protease modulator HflK n=1 Tax=Croceicoccus esteveae TaxID=3075597 RepID=A0ABU2ZJK4_9SPHN|nr:protease modulator HflK [Croceicoccus sp. F390]MDT0576792.1 protease modulator HflK [Croceicoccus sp. F390]